MSAVASDRLRLDLYVLQDVPFDEIVERCHTAERLGFDAVHVADHTGDFRDLDGDWLDGWIVLAGLAVRTRTLRLGVLVSNPILRHPVVLVKQAIAVDRLSGGRLEIGIGTGIAQFDHAAVGSDPWPPRERVSRFAEVVEVVHGLLSANGREFSFSGRFYRTEHAPTAPGPLQQPRPPITIGGQSRTVRRVAAERGDCWNTHGPFGCTREQIIEITRRQNAELDDHCLRLGRDPRSLRRAALLFGALDPWATGIDAVALVERLWDAGCREFVVFWPPDGDVERLEAMVTELRALTAP